MKTNSKASECKFTYCVWFRKGKIPAFAVEITCTVHKPRATWSAMTNDLEAAKGLIDIFPLVEGGLAMGDGCFKIHDDCIVGKIPPKKKT